MAATKPVSHDRGDASAARPRLFAARRFETLPGIQAAAALLREIDDGDAPEGARLPCRPLVLYGGGDLGRMAHDHLTGLGFAVDIVVDRNAAALRNDRFWAGTRLVAPDEVSGDIKADALLAVCVATAPFVPLARSLQDSGWRDIVPFYDLAESCRDRHPLSNGWFAGRLDVAERNAVESVLGRWHDDLSRAHHLQFIAWRRLRAEWTFADAPVTGDDRFFIPEVLPHLGKVGTFVDAGAHHGRVTERLVALRGGAGLRVVAVEPDRANLAVLQSRIGCERGVAGEWLTLVPEALDAVERDRVFHAGLGYASQLSPTGAERVRTVTLDGLGVAPDYVKLHLEGGELDALRGGLATIKAHRPILAVTVYHNDDGLWRTPAFLMEGLENYRFLLRLHGWCGTGAVLYALPGELR